MTELRWILLALGVVIVAGVYAWGRRTPSTSETVARKAPDLGDLAPPPPAPDPPEHGTPKYVAPEEGEAQVAAEAETETDAPQEPVPEPPVADKVVRLHLVGTEGEKFNAAEMVAALRAEGLRFGHFDLFHRFAGEGNPGPESEPLFSVSDMLKPGTFDLETLAEHSLRGVSLFMLLPNPGEPVTVFADMLATGRRLAATLGGQLVDTQGCSVSRQSASHMREDIINYRHGMQPAGALEEDRVT